jgi:nicotinamidase-related amidase
MMSNTALLVIDVQNAMFSEEDPVYKSEKLVQTLKGLIEKAIHSQTPVIYIQHNESEGAPLAPGTTGWEIYPEIAPMEHDLIIQKKTPDSFYQTPLDEELKKRSITHLVITGIQTEVCVDTTTRSAFSHDYEVTLVSDAHGTWNSEHLNAEQIIVHHNNMLRWFAETKTSDEIVFE